MLDNFYTGDTKTIWFKIWSKSAQTFIDLQGATIYLTIKKDRTQADTTALLTKEFHIPLGASVYQEPIVIEHTDTKDFDGGRYYFEIRFKDKDGNVATPKQIIQEIKQSVRNEL